jgi:hypothetical protein
VNRLGDSSDVGFGARHDRDTGAFSRERLGDAESDASRRAGDERDLPLDAEVHLPKS